MNKNKDILKSSSLKNHLGYFNKNREQDKSVVLDLNNLPALNIKEENVSEVDEIVSLSPNPFDSSAVKYEVDEEGIIPEDMSSVPLLYKPEASLQYSSSASSPGSDRSTSPVSSVTISSPYMPASVVSSSKVQSSGLPKTQPVFVSRSAQQLQAVVSSSSALQHVLVINPSPYQIVVPSQTNQPHQQLRTAMQLQLMSKPGNVSLKSNAALQSSRHMFRNSSGTSDELKLPSPGAPNAQESQKLLSAIFPKSLSVLPDKRKVQEEKTTQVLLQDSNKSPVSSKTSLETSVGIENSNVNNVHGNTKKNNDSSSIFQETYSTNDSSNEQIEEPEDVYIHDIHEGATSPSSSHDFHSQGSDTECSIPNLLNDCGKYGFKVYLDDKKDTLKTPTWLMSNITHKLYTNMNKPIPFRVILKKAENLKTKLYLRAMAVFKYPMFLRHNVVRCPHHLNPLDPSNTDFHEHLNHVIRADHPRAVYECSSSGRLSVVVPLDFPENRQEAVPVLLKFMCHNSCVGGISRRPLAVLLTLEQLGEELGRSVIDVRVCACPSRDVRSEEKQVISRGLYKKTISHTFVGRRARKRQRPDEIPNLYDEQDEILYIPVRGVALYNYLIEMKSLYLKHHSDYAQKYPDVRPTEDTNHLNEIIDPGAFPSIPSVAAVTKNKDDSILRQTLKQSSDVHSLIYKRDDETGQSYVLQSDLCEAFMSGENAEPYMDHRENSPQRQLRNIAPYHVRTDDEDEDYSFYQEQHSSLQNGYHRRKSVTNCCSRKHSDSNISRKIITKSGPFANNSVVTEQSHQISAKESPSKSIKRLNREKHSSKTHVQAFPMPDTRGVPILPKPLSRETGALSSSPENSPQSPENNESEKVMLAAQVLASHLGSQN